MKRIITILLLLIQFVSFAQMEHLPTVAWRTNIENVTQLTDSTYRVAVEPIDLNELGAANRVIGNYLKDWAGYIYLIIDSTSTTVDVKDVFQTGYGPRLYQQGIIYKSVDNGEAPYLAPISYSHLDESALDYGRKIELSVLWKEASLYSKDSIKIVWWSDTLSIPGIATKYDIKRIQVITHEPSGFEHPVDVIVNYNSTNRTITLTGNTTAFWRGDTITSLVSGWTSVAHTATTGIWYLYYNGTSFIWSQDPWTFDVVQIAFVNYNQFATKETHGLMPYQTHKELHETIGTYLSAGGDISDYTLNSTTAADRRPLVSTTSLNDEDNQTNEPALTTESYTKFSLSGTNTPNYDAASSDIVSLTGNQPNWNEFTGGTWVQTPMANNSYAAVWLVGIPVTADAQSQVYRFLWVQPQTNSSTLSTIQALSPSSVSLGNLQNLTPELVFIGKITIQYTAANWRLVSVEKLIGNKLNQQAIIGGSYLSIVTTDVTLSGNGTSTDPLKVDTTIIATQPDLAAGLATKEPANANIQQHITNDGDLSATNELQIIDTFRIANNILELSLSADGQAKKTVDLSGFAPSTGSGSYIWNGTTMQTADFNISGSGIINEDLTKKITGTYPTDYVLTDFPITQSSECIVILGEWKAGTYFTDAPYSVSGEFYFNNSQYRYGKNGIFKVVYNNGYSSAYQHAQSNYIGQRNNNYPPYLVTFDYNGKTWMGIDLPASGSAHGFTSGLFSGRKSSNVTFDIVDATVVTNKTIYSITDQTATNIINSNLVIGGGNFVANNVQLTQKTVTSQETASLGSELLTSSDWTSTDWTGDFSTGFTHTTGNLTPLSNSLAGSIGNMFKITITITGRTAGSIVVNFGGIPSLSLTASTSFSPRCNTTGNLLITPTTDFNGTVGLSLVQITTLTPPTHATLNSSLVASRESRSSLAGSTNMFDGINTGRAITTGTGNTGYGYGTYSYLTSGIGNTAFGVTALSLVSTGDYNTAIGNSVLSNNTYGSYNVGLGYVVMSNNSSGSQNIGIGRAALNLNTTGSNNIAIGGRNSLYNNTTGSNNIAMGYYSIFSNQTGVGNIGIGTNNLNALNGANNNVSIGYYALEKLTDGGTNVAVGAEAGRYINSGTVSNTSSDYSIFIGSSSKPLADNAQNEIVIGYTATGLGSNSIMLGNSSLTKLGIGNVEVFYQPLKTGYAGTLNQILASNGVSTAPSWKSLADLGIAPSTGSTAYIQNQINAAQTPANFWIDGTAKANILQSTVTTGTEPLTVASTTLVSNLNADLLDGQHGSYYQTAITNPVTGTGTANYIPKWEVGGTSLTGTSNIYDDGTRVGIGTTAPDEILTIGDFTSTSNKILKLRTASGYDTGIEFFEHTEDTGMSIIYDGGDNKMYFKDSDNIKMTLERTTGNVGIGTTPSYALDIKSTSTLNTLALRASGAANGEGILLLDGGTPTKYNFYIGAQRNIDNGFEITPSTTVGGTTFTTPALTILRTGLVGIGTTGPSTTLDVNGNARFRSIGTGTLSSLLGVTSDGTLTSGTSGALGTILVGSGTTTAPTWQSVNSAIGENALTTGYIPYWDGNKLANSTLIQSNGYLTLDNLYAGFLAKSEETNKWIIADDALVTDTLPNDLGIYLYGDNDINLFTNNLKIASFGYTNGIVFDVLSGVGTRLVTVSATGQLDNIVNTAGYLYNDGSGNYSYLAIDLSNYYTKTDLQTSGSASVHWDNITNEPTFLTSYTETDPIFAGDSAKIQHWSDTLSLDGTKYDDRFGITAYNWGNHANAGYLTSYTETDPVWAAAINNYYTKTNVQTSGQAAIHWANITNAPSFITDYTETDPIFGAHTVSSIVNGTGFLKNNGSGTWTWDNSTYSVSTHDHSGTYEVPLTFSTGLNRTGNTISNTITQYTDALARSSISLTTTGNSGGATYDNLTGILNIPNYSFSESLFIADSAQILHWSDTINYIATLYDISNFLVSETDPIFSAHTTENIVNGTGLLKNDGSGNWTYITDYSANWEAAYEWGNHSSVGYLTSYTETDPIWSAAAANYYTKTELQTSGQSSIHWDNITNEPVFQLASDTTSFDATKTFVINAINTAISNIEIGNATSTVNINQVEHGFSVGNAIYLDDKYYKAKADNINTSDVIGIVVEVFSVDSFMYAISGLIAGNYTEGENYFLSNAVAGAIIPEPTYQLNEVRQFIGTGLIDGYLLIELDLGSQISEQNGEIATTGDTISSMYYSNDTLYVTESGNLWKAEIVGGSGGGSTLYEKELSTNETTINTGILLDANCIVWINGEIIPTAYWSGEGTLNVTLTMAINQYDNLIVYKSSLPISSLFEAELTNNQTTIDIGFTPNTTTIIFFNGEALMNDKWSTTGTEITLLFPVVAYDKLTAKN